MYCKHCGKELSDEAPICPNCGTPTENSVVRKAEKAVGAAGRGKTSACAIAGFTLSLISFVATIVLVTMGMVSGIFQGESLYMFAGLGALVLSIIGLCEAKQSGNGIARGLAIAGIVFASVALFYCFIIYAVSFPLYSGRYYPYY